MKYLRLSASLRLLPYLLFKPSTPFSETSTLQRTKGIISDKASCTIATNLNHRHQSIRFYRYIPGKTSITAQNDDMTIAENASDLTISTRNSSSIPWPSNNSQIQLCPKCRGEGKIAKAPSKKARLRHQRRIYQQENEQTNSRDDVQHNLNYHIKESPPIPSPLAKNPAETLDKDGNSDGAKRQKPQLPRLPRRWDPCPNCDQTGLMLSVESKSSEISPTVTTTDHLPFVAIIGGGIGGMALAVALQHRRIPFMIYEKDTRFDQRRQGYGLTLQQARRALEALGIFETNDDAHNSNFTSAKLLQEHSVTSTKHVVHTPDGKQVGEWGLRRWIGDSNRKEKDDINTRHNCVNSCESNNRSKSFEANAGTSSRTKQRPVRAKNKKRRQNLHVPRQILRLALMEALKEASDVHGEEAGVLSKNSALNSDSTRHKRTAKAKHLHDNHNTVNISWGHKLVNIQPLNNSSSTNDVQLTFEVVDESGSNKRIINSQANLVVGCDGIRSSVREQLFRANAITNDKFDEREDDNSSDTALNALRYLNCFVILGICPLENLFSKEGERVEVDFLQQQKENLIGISPLLDGKTVFQTADGTTRIYLMPYSKKNNEYMWQLSFPVDDEELAIGLSRRGSKALKEEALKRCQSWHTPIPEILVSTPVELVSGYPVYDREILTADSLVACRENVSEKFPSQKDEKYRSGADNSIDSHNHFSIDCNSIPITLLGDAAHPMSPFKGQGANQALLDALSLARSLYRTHGIEERSIEEALKHYESEMLDRSAKKVRASSEAAQFLHSDIAIQEGDVTRGAAAAAAQDR